MMNSFLLITQLAWRNIWRNKARSFVIMLSVIIGLVAGIGVLALYKGMIRSRVRTVIESEVGHIQLHHPQFKKDHDPAFVLGDAESLVRKVVTTPYIELAAPRTITQGMLVTTTGSAGVQINGVIPDLEYRISNLKSKIRTGDGFHAEKKYEIIIGRKLADKMKLKQGSKVVLTFTDTSGSMVSSAFRVCSIYQSENTPLDEWNVYVTMSTLNELLLTGDSCNEIALLLTSDEHLEYTTDNLRKAFPGYQVETWKEISPETELMVKTVDEYSYIIMVIIFVALAFGILNTMLMSVLERTREIGMMVALGTSRIRIFLLILFETVFLTIAGAPFGMLAAYLITHYFGLHGLDLSGMGKELMASFGYSTMIYPSFPWDKLPGIVIMVFGTAIMSSMFPAIKALRLQEVEALRR
jgi:ABC-type lipoprotein release transport system permease subunit